MREVENWPIIKTLFKFLGDFNILPLLSSEVKERIASGGMYREYTEALLLYDFCWPKIEERHNLIHKSIITRLRYNYLMKNYDYSVSDLPDKFEANTALNSVGSVPIPNDIV